MWWNRQPPLEAEKNQLAEVRQLQELSSKVGIQNGASGGTLHHAGSDPSGSTRPRREELIPNRHGAQQRQVAVDSVSDVQDLDLRNRLERLLQHLLRKQESRPEEGKVATGDGACASASLRPMQ